MAVFSDQGMCLEDENILTRSAVINLARTTLVPGIMYSQLQVVTWEIWFYEVITTLLQKGLAERVFAGTSHNVTMPLYALRILHDTETRDNYIETHNDSRRI
jgi:hypothetical protein